MVALRSATKPSIAAEVAKENNGTSTGQSDSSSRGSDPATDTEQCVSKKSIFAGVVNTQPWYRFQGEGFSPRVPPGVEDIMEAEVRSVKCGDTSFQPAQAHFL